MERELKSILWLVICYGGRQTDYHPPSMQSVRANSPLIYAIERAETNTQGGINRDAMNQTPEGTTCPRMANRKIPIK